jgi:hypothetical protein
MELSNSIPGLAIAAMAWIARKQLEKRISSGPNLVPANPQRLAASTADWRRMERSSFRRIAR